MQSQETVQRLDDRLHAVGQIVPAIDVTRRESELRT
jgi:hypothetical protein